MNSDGMQGKIGSIYTYCPFDLIYTILEKKSCEVLQCSVCKGGEV